MAGLGASQLRHAEPEAAFAPGPLQGPPEKPLLCNACGARFLVKHSLEGYVPNAKPCAAKRECGAPKPKKEAGLRALAVHGRPAGEKRMRTLSKR